MAETYSSFPIPPFEDGGNLLASAIPLPDSVFLLEVKDAIWVGEQDRAKQDPRNKIVFQISAIQIDRGHLITLSH